MKNKKYGIPLYINIVRRTRENNANIVRDGKVSHPTSTQRDSMTAERSNTK
jgi:hypothetical protein